MAKKEKTAEAINLLDYYSARSINLINTAIDKDLPMLLIGETGTGKTTLVREIARERGQELYRINMTGQTGTDEIVGRWLASPKEGTFCVDGLLIRAMKEGAIVVLDELNMALPEILSKLHALLDDDKFVVITEKDGEMVRPHKNFRLFATMNPSGDYMGTKEMNMAFISRFPIVENMEISDKEHEIISSVGGIDEDKGKVLTMLLQELRNAKKEQKISFFASTRDAIQAAKLIAHGMDVGNAVEVAIVNKAQPEERMSVKKVAELVTGYDASKFVTIESLKEKLDKAEKVVKLISDEREELLKTVKDSEERAENWQKNHDAIKEELTKQLAKTFTPSTLIPRNKK